MTALSTAYFLVTSKGALFPVDYDGDIIDSPSLSSLTYLCTEVIAHDASYLKRICSFLPIHIYSLLMKTALRKGYNTSVAVLLPFWPKPTFSIRELWPQLFDNLQFIYDCKFAHDRVKTAVTLSTMLLNLFLTIVVNDSAPRLRSLDLRGIPTVDRIIRNVTREIESLLWSGSRLHVYHIYLDCAIRDEDTCCELTSILDMIQNSPNPKLHLHISQLDLSCLGYNKISELLQTVNVEELSGLSLQYNSLGNEDFSKFILPELSRFPYMNALDISCNNLFYVSSSTRDQEVTRDFTCVCERLHHLRRIDLSNNRLSNNLYNVLSWQGIDRMEYLKLSACTLMDSDLRFLSMTKLNLCELDLSENSVVSRRVDLMGKLLTALAPTLRILEIEDCKLQDYHINFLKTFLLLVINLRYLNLSHHRFSFNCIRDSVCPLGSMPHLDCIRLSFPIEFNNVTSPGEVNGSTIDKIRERLATKKSPPTRIEWTRPV